MGMQVAFLSRCGPQCLPAALVRCALGGAAAGPKRPGGRVRRVVSSESSPSRLRMGEPKVSVFKSGGQDGCPDCRLAVSSAAPGLCLRLNAAQGLLVSTWLGFPC